MQAIQGPEKEYLRLDAADSCVLYKHQIRFLRAGAVLFCTPFLLVSFFSEIPIRLTMTWTRKPVKMHFYGLSVSRWSVSFYGQCYVQGFFFSFALWNLLAIIVRSGQDDLIWLTHFSLFLRINRHYVFPLSWIHWRWFGLEFWIRNTFLAAVADTERKTVCWKRALVRLFLMGAREAIWGCGCAALSFVFLFSCCFLFREDQGWMFFFCSLVLWFGAVGLEIAVGWVWMGDLVVEGVEWWKIKKKQAREGNEERWIGPLKLNLFSTFFSLLSFNKRASQTSLKSRPRQTAGVRIWRGR